MSIGIGARWLGLFGLLLATLLLWESCASASAAPLPPRWEVESKSKTSVEPGSEVAYSMALVDAGDMPIEGEVTVTVSLPEGMKAVKARVADFQAGAFRTCTAANGVDPVSGQRTVVCKTPTVLIPPLNVNAPVLFLTAKLDPEASGELLVGIAVSGAGAPPYETVDPIEVGPPTAFGIESFDAEIAADRAGVSSTQAGSHPYGINTDIRLNSSLNPRGGLTGEPWPAEPVRDIFVHEPPGFIGSPKAIPQCTMVQLAKTNGFVSEPLCPSESQVGVVNVRLPGLGSPWAALYNVVPPAGAPARFGFSILGTFVLLEAEVDSEDDYEIVVASRKIVEGLPLTGVTTDFWGVPADPSHDGERACPGSGDIIFCPSGSEPAAFLRNPTSCTASPGTGAPTSIQADSWFHPGAFEQSSFLSHAAPGSPYPSSMWGPQVGFDGCEGVPFEPTITLQPTTNAADSPTGLDFELTMPQDCWEAKPTVVEVEDAQCQADVKDSSVIQPLGTRVNPAAADGLSGCSEAQIGFIGTGFPLPNPTHFTSAQPTCPDSSKIGSVEIESPLLSDTLNGSIYQAKQGENPFGSTLGFYAVADADGVMIKLPAEVRTDPETGQVTTIFKDSPQLPFTHYRLHFDGGPRAPLITPPTCGAFTTHTTFTGWANPDQPAHPEDTFQITEGPNGTPCAGTAAARPFAPGFEAGTVNPLAGAFSPFVLKISREDGMQELTGLETTLPPGLIGKLAGIPYCSDAAIAAAEHHGGAAERANPSCPAASAVGVTDAAAGAGPLPFHNPGTAYLAGPYKGAPLSMAIVTPAVAGPLDLGTVVVRAALHVDPTTTQITAVSDPLPTKIVVDNGGLLDGFPLALRGVTVQMNRPNFTLNPTSCDPMAVTGVVGGANGTSASVSNRFQVGNCSTLAFKPKLALRLKGGTKRSKFPSLRATLKMPAANSANIARAAVTLPPGLQIENAHIQEPCTRVQFNADACPAKSILGSARAFSPLLDQPLEGPVYFRSNGGEHLLPDIVADLRGQIHVVLVGHIDSVENKHTGVVRIRNTFETVPDAPVSKFTLNLFGGKRGYLTNNRNLCNSANKALVKFDGQNGKIADSTPAIKTDCGKGKGKKGGKR